MNKEAPPSNAFAFMAPSADAPPSNAFAFMAPPAEDQESKPDQENADNKKEEERCQPPAFSFMTGANTVVQQEEEQPAATSAFGFI